jgi:hypothetical protein
VAWPGEVWHGVAWRGVAWHGVCRMVSHGGGVRSTSWKDTIAFMPVTTWYPPSPPRTTPVSTVHHEVAQPEALCSA